MACPQVRIVVQHPEPKLTHLATRWTLPFEDSELKIPLKDAETFSYPELQVMLRHLPSRSAASLEQDMATDSVADAGSLPVQGAAVPVSQESHLT